jgi:hypothetical protein
MPTRKPLSVRWIGFAVLAVLFGGYVLSIGPAARWCSRDYGGRTGAFDAAYAPVIAIMERSDSLRGIVRAYCRWWIINGYLP